MQDWVLIAINAAVTVVLGTAGFFGARTAGLWDRVIEQRFGKKLEEHRASLQLELETHKTALELASWRNNKRAEVVCEVYSRLEAAKSKGEEVYGPAELPVWQAAVWSSRPIRDFWQRYRAADEYVRQNRLHLDPSTERAVFAVLAGLNEFVDKAVLEEFEEHSGTSEPDASPSPEDYRAFIDRMNALDTAREHLRALLRDAD